MEDQLQLLQQEHKALDEAVSTLQRSPTHCSLQLQKMKRTKLHLKQRIDQLKRQVQQVAAE